MGKHDHDREYSSSSRWGKSRGRDKERDRERDRESGSGSRRERRDRDRSRSRSPAERSSGKSSRRREKDSNDGKGKGSLKVEDIVGVDMDYHDYELIKDEQQRKLELVMQQRRERVEKWREKHQKSTGSQGGSQDMNTTGEKEGEDNSNTNEMNSEEKKPAWTLDDENDDDEEEGGEQQMDLADSDEEDENKPPLPPMRVVQEAEEEETMVLSKMPEVKKETKVENKGKVNSSEEEKAKKVVEVKEEEEDPDIDPLDAYMKSVQEEVKKYRSQTHTTTTTTTDSKDSNKITTVVMGIAKKSQTQQKKHDRGELIEQNQDALEYSSEDEGGRDEELANAMDNLQNKNKSKRLMTITQDEVTFSQFRKNFYIEVPEIAKMTVAEVEEFRASMEGIKAKGKGCPKPIKSWAQCGVSKKILEVLKRNNYEKPTPIQCQAIPAIMSGRDLIGIAKTGSGKTLAFLLPMFRHILDQPELEPGDGPIAIIMTPTRELATQIWQECRRFTKTLGLRAVAVYGGTPISEQIGELKPGAEMVVCTPGRMIDMLAANNGRVTNVRRCTYVVLDEADRMFDLGFEPQVTRIMDNIRPDRQTVMFSATFPRIMESLARRILDRPIEVQVGGRSIVCKEVEQNIVIVDEEEKFLKLLEVLGRYATIGSAIVFVDKQENADMVLKELMHASYSCLALHGGIDQNDRDSTITDFKNGKVNVLVATSVAARGLDVRHCIVVVNYDCPNHYEDYVHRVGRTGRAGNKGYAYTFITSEQGRYSGEIIKALELSSQEVPEKLQSLWNEYKQEQERFGKKVKSSSGFSGKGFKFDEAEAQLAIEKKKFQKAALGLQDSDDDEEQDIDQEIEQMLQPKKSTKTVAISNAPMTGNVADKTIAEKLEIAKRTASKLAVNVQSGGSTSSQTEAFLRGEMINPRVPSASAARSKAEMIADRLHAKLNYIPKDVEYNEEGEMVRRVEQQSEEQVALASGLQQRYEEELEINDFPQQARWKVTSKEAIAQISEYSEAGITVRGTFVPSNAKVNLEAGERKLYLAIEGTSELAVSKARAEIIRLIKEELVKMQNSYQPANRGRYKVL